MCPLCVTTAALSVATATTASAIAIWGIDLFALIAACWRRFHRRLSVSGNQNGGMQDER
jgi:hypothetical protein